MFEEDDSMDGERSEMIGRAVDDLISPDVKLDFLRSTTGLFADRSMALLAEIWKELDGCVSPAGEVLPHADRTFVPPRGWSGIVRKLILVRHNLNQIQQFCEE